VITKFHLRYIKYLFESITKYNINSPFLYDLVTQVFDDKKSYPEYKKVEHLKKELLKNSEIIEVTDLGAGSKTGKQTERSVKQIVKYSSKPKKIGRLLFRLSNYFKPGQILELGTSVGLSSMYLSYGYRSAKVVTIEGCPNISHIAQTNFEQLGMSNIQLVTGNFDDELIGVLEKVKSIDLAFIDGNHQQQPTIKYFEQCLSFSGPDTVLIFDDIHWSEGMEKAWQHIINHPSVTLSIDIFFIGIVFLKPGLSKQHFVIRF
jgi:predicted O-methyltransferase YrrM